MQRQHTKSYRSNQLPDSKYCVTIHSALYFYICYNGICRKYGVNVSYAQSDLSTPSGVESLCEQVLQLHPGGVDILVNNAGTCIFFMSPQ